MSQDTSLMKIKIQIPKNAKVADIADRLKNPIEYVRVVFATLVEYGGRKDSDDYLVFLSLQSEPSAPDYSVYEIMDRETGGGITLTARNGRTHREIDFEKSQSIFWAHEGSNFNEMRELIGALRGVTSIPNLPSRRAPRS